MAENTLQFDWIVKITGGLRHLFAGAADVFIAGDLFWYPVEGRPDVRVAPDTMVVIGRPPGHRRCYLQWEEGGIAPQVVFEVLSPGNRVREMLRKFEFYRQHGVEEYYIYDPDHETMELTGYVRHGADLIEIPQMHGHLSPRLKITFEMGADGLRLIRPDGREFVTYEEVASDADCQRSRADAAENRARLLQAELDRLRGTEPR